MASEPTTIVRTRTFRAYLSKCGHANLADFFQQLAWLWNVALNERRQAYERDGSSLSFYDQCKTLTLTRQAPDWSRFPVKAQRSVLNREARESEPGEAEGGTRPGMAEGAGAGKGCAPRVAAVAAVGHQSASGWPCACSGASAAAIIRIGT